MGEDKNSHEILVGKPEEKRALGRLRYRWEDIIVMDLRKIVGKVWTGFFWVRKGTIGRLL
jgi:hypothetical protein